MNHEIKTLRYKKGGEDITQKKGKKEIKEKGKKVETATARSAKVQQQFYWGHILASPAGKIPYTHPVCALPRNLIMLMQSL
jgi:hypothetical protein